jgi:hypothetical protein
MANFFFVLSGAPISMRFAPPMAFARLRSLFLGDGDVRAEVRADAA